VTPQEEQLINSLVERVNRTQLQEKDPDAEALLNNGLSSNPDALYILAQSVLIQNIALDQAKAQVAQLQQQVQQARQQPVRAASAAAGVYSAAATGLRSAPAAAAGLRPAIYAAAIRSVGTA
jgi:hypothetical protein